ncbi:MAG: LLM class flavin-dependent oxidoreductase [Rhodospirillaceae bacterium]|jgi:long-chain alkane monooxygenase|nr:LLM class flavin-dependent oxidoreductase [Rhodospirillaceae bacterium]MBT5081265.1 LLM class flavin-dependent oxidoreductase [Rhodospirillaceae bacterium]MBT5523731.1 LLM class flavin-dependent oxidoreductase [Rhodospirillaceae bacterium]MBT5878322.1 LLM class flavin-dependent oxidoreductase [Rhodospirillaceae bacterium]MBT6591827.1 LLM class flavin-dependent oxidoreductase [Rhodospirillaceae bacterium]
MARKKMHLAQFLVHGPTYHSLAMWRHPETAARNYDWTQPELYQHIAQVCERGKFDMVFFADLNYISDTFRNSLEPALRYAAQAPEHDPIPLITSMAAVTSHVGLGATFSVSHHNPFYAARLWATLDHLTKGRAAWNVVTSLNHNQAANYGEERADTDSRYDRAHEFVEVCQKLWQSWDEDAVVMDRENAIFADANKVHRIEHQGEFFKSRGPLNVVRSRHGGPPIIQAGTSPKGMDLAAKYADAIFAIQPRVENAAEYYTAVKGRMEGFGRRPEDCKILFGMQPIIGASEAEAVEKQELHNSLMPLDGGMTILSSHMDFDLSKLDPNEKIAERTEPELQRMHSRFLKPSGESMTVAEVAQRHGEGVSLPQFVGTPEAIVDQMEAYIDVVGGDGFMISPIYCPGAIEEFVDQVVPELQRRGLFRTDYAGTTQRDHLGQYD